MWEHFFKIVTVIVADSDIFMKSDSANICITIFENRTYNCVDVRRW